ncbi:MAG: replication protein [bacterium]|nr:replication protein [bacterium]
MSGMIYDNGDQVGTYTVFPNDILEKIDDLDLTIEERKVLHRIIRDTVGYEREKKPDGTSVRKTSNHFPINRFLEKTDLSEQDIETALDNLKERKIISRYEDGITLNNHVEEWI